MPDCVILLDKRPTLIAAQNYGILKTLGGILKLCEPRKCANNSMLDKEGVPSDVALHPQGQAWRPRSWEASRHFSSAPITDFTNSLPPPPNDPHKLDDLSNLLRYQRTRTRFTSMAGLKTIIALSFVFAPPSLPLSLSFACASLTDTPA